MKVFDAKDAVRLNALPWHIEVVKQNPEYPFWGPGDDYMGKILPDGDPATTWASGSEVQSWGDFASKWYLDDYNECVNYYFNLMRESCQCKVCNGTGYHPESLHVHGTYYKHQCYEHGFPSSMSWKDNITQDEADCLIAKGRFKPGTTAEEINAENRPGAGGFGHDSINAHFLIEARCKRLNLKCYCDNCNGESHVYTSDVPELTLTLWMIRPRKGASTGVRIRNIQESDLTSIQAFLAEAAQRNAKRMSFTYNP